MITTRELGRKWSLSSSTDYLNKSKNYAVRSNPIGKLKFLCMFVEVSVFMRIVNRFIQKYASVSISVYFSVCENIFESEPYLFSFRSFTEVGILKKSILRQQHGSVFFSLKTCSHSWSFRGFVVSFVLFFSYINSQLSWH